MTPFEEHQLGSRIAAQDTLLGVLMGVAMTSGPVSPAALAQLIEDQAMLARKSGQEAQAAFLIARANVLRAI